MLLLPESKLSPELVNSRKEEKHAEEQTVTAPYRLKGLITNDRNVLVRTDGDLNLPETFVREWCWRKAQGARSLADAVCWCFRWI